MAESSPDPAPTPIEARVLAETRRRLDAGDLPDEAVRRTFVYQSALLAEHARELGRTIRRAFEPLRRMFPDA